MIVLHSFTPKPPCVACAGPTFVAEPGVWRIWADEETGEPRGVWLHAFCSAFINALALRFGGAR